MSRKGNCLEVLPFGYNAVMENFFGLLKSELLYLQGFQFLKHFKQQRVEYLVIYNNSRIKVESKGLPTALHRQQALIDCLNNFYFQILSNFLGSLHLSEGDLSTLIRR